MLIGAGLKKFPPNVKIITMQFTRVFTAIPMLFYGGLWCIKLAFLLFFRRLGLRNVTSLQRWWRLVLVATVVAFFVCYALLPYRCTFVSFEVVASEECQTQGLSFVAMGVNTALDVVTDCLSMSNNSLRYISVTDELRTVVSLPFLILQRIRISTQQKIALSVVFSLVIVTMIFAIIRGTITTVGVKRQIDPLWMYLWTSIELNVGTKSPSEEITGLTQANSYHGRLYCTLPIAIHPRSYHFTRNTSITKVQRPSMQALERLSLTII